MGRLSRRLVFVTGLGAVVGSVLSACAVSRPVPSGTEGFSSSPSATEDSFWDDPDQAGVTKYWEFQAVGKFVPATREHQAWGVPIPRVHSSHYDYSVSDLWSTLACWVSAVNYMLLTGETEPLKAVDPELKTARPDLVKLYEDEAGWVIGRDALLMESPVKLELLTAKPVETAEGSQVFTWSARLSVDADASVFHVETEETRSLGEVLGLRSGEVQLQVAYVDGKWRSETAYDAVYSI